MTKQWVLAVFAVLGGFFVSAIVGSIATDAIGFWPQPGMGFCAALTVVVMTYLAAPNFKLASACAALVIGAAIAWRLVEPSFFPESYAERGAYQPTHVPIIATYIGGILGLVIAKVLDVRRLSNAHGI